MQKQHSKKYNSIVIYSMSFSLFVGINHMHSLYHIPPQSRLGLPHNESVASVTYIISFMSCHGVCVWGGAVMDSSWIHTLSANSQIILIMFPASNNEDTFLALSASIALFRSFLIHNIVTGCGCKISY